MTRIFVDLDGVMADFDAHFPALFGVNHKDLLDDEMWKHINNHPSYFRDMPLCDGAVDFWDWLVNLTMACSLEPPIILTACSKTNYGGVARQKKEWVRENPILGYYEGVEYPMVLPVLGGRNKCLFLQEPGDILIDDWDHNTIPWIAEGGRAILHTDFGTTSTLLQGMADRFEF